jgi:hypothetical protein
MEDTIYAVIITLVVMLILFLILFFFVPTAFQSLVNYQFKHSPSLYSSLCPICPPITTCPPPAPNGGGTGGTGGGTSGTGGTGGTTDDNSKAGGSSIQSPLNFTGPLKLLQNEKASLLVQGDGNIVIYGGTSGNDALSTAGTNTSSFFVTHGSFASNGSLYFYNKDNKAVVSIINDVTNHPAPYTLTLTTSGGLEFTDANKQRVNLIYVLPKGSLP